MYASRDAAAADAFRARESRAADLARPLEQRAAAGADAGTGAAAAGSAQRCGHGFYVTRAKSHRQGVLASRRRCRKDGGRCRVAGRKSGRLLSRCRLKCQMDLL